MSYSSKLVRGALRYRTAKTLESVLGTNISADPDGSSSSAASRLKLHPCFLSLPALALPAQLDRAAINYLREHSLSSPKAIESRAELMNNYLWSRQLSFDTQAIHRTLSSDGGVPEIGNVDACDPELAQAVECHPEEQLTQIRKGALRKMKQEALDEWKSITYSGHNCELYLTARLAPNFASVCRVLYEIRKRCPKFIPRNLFDFGSGLGTVTWAVNTVWPVGCVKEHLMFEPSADMTRLSEFMLQKNLVVKSPETIFPGVYHRRFLPANSQQYDLVVSAHSLMELPGTKSRHRVLSNLWNKTSDFLVLVEQGTKAGFTAILEARDWLVTEGGGDVFFFAPCPHKLICGKADSVCNISVQYYPFGLTVENNEPSTELISYLVVSRGDWRRHQSPVIEEDPQFLPRLVSYGLNSEKVLVHDICLPDGNVERTSFSKKSTDKPLYYYLRHAKAGDILPCVQRTDFEMDGMPDPVVNED
ncbi:methyltransferase-like protein 17 mitochondrial [Clonorchis sinensis]|uniref:Methyltransferase-like protein 17 mitochondrial n=1 Tax=Clonorchis sinensis TaxID=79923 RepID=H2KPN9_CLOSI|nr:methyltransferase-like protein 17 mitochondrial [Clonorchis sinensis]